MAAAQGTRNKTTVTAAQGLLLGAGQRPTGTNFFLTHPSWVGPAWSAQQQSAPEWMKAVRPTVCERGREEMGPARSAELPRCWEKPLQPSSSKLASLWWVKRGKRGG